MLGCNMVGKLIEPLNSNDVLTANEEKKVCNLNQNNLNLIGIGHIVKISNIS